MKLGRQDPSRRAMALGALGTLAAGGAVNLPFVSRGVAAPNDRRYSRRTVDLVHGAWLIDMLGSIWFEMDLDPQGWRRDLPAKQAADWRASGITAINHAIGLGGPDAFEKVLEWIAGWNGFVSRHSDLFLGVGSVADIDLAKTTRRTAVIRGLQDSDHFRTVADVALFHGLGQRVSLLTYNEQNMIGSGSTERVDGGVSDYGASVIAEMNRVGMLVDVSHSGDKTTLDAIALSAGPIAIGHSNCRAISGHVRAKTDEAITRLAAKGGVMGISGVRPFVKATDPTTLQDIVDHIDHVAKLVGIEHVGVGSDSDLYGYDALPPAILKALMAGYSSKYGFRARADIDGFNHPLKFYDLTEALIGRGYTDEHISLVLGGNFRRLLTRAWTPAHG